MKGQVGAVLRTATLAAALAVAPASAQDVYRWVDEDGVVHYSDQPRDGAEKVEVREPQTYSVEEALPATPTARDSSAVDGPERVTGYSSLRIAVPEHDSVAWNTGGEITVQVAPEPALVPGHQVVVFLDGQAVDGTPVASTTIGLTGMYRGSYQLRASIVDENNRQVIESPAITFHVRQTSIQNPQRRPR